ncbi:putative Kinesin-II 95 kDa subunit [Blattamonas nauphoetae]|uniref:Kinesin-II 95 kDa subunit n=1 Tax=Blattamonas nauphoetae TaxID=2049346 RepID=A0ABQ9XK36_9EUKA|nr:putative Kinesin-II 95 kDa subunit [Blattamonas nauphoetae]
MSEAVTVAVRVRPLNSKEIKEKCTEIQTVSGKSITVTNPDNRKEKKTFTFDFVYGTNTTQQMVYSDLGLAYLENAWNGFNCTLFAYGQTGSGKSFSMTGDISNQDTRGIIPRGCEEMFKRIEDNTDPNISYECSFLEMYNEKLQDLLDPKTTKTISVRESPTKGIFVDNCLEELVETYAEINKLLEDGNKARTVAATAMNSTSSRSHSVLTIFFTRKELISGKTTQRQSRINLVDLAGSERQSKTGATGDRLTEAAAINTSLSALGNVIKALADISSGKKNIFVPYRDSLLTRMLQDSLGGNSKTIMIAAMSPASSNYDEGISTLQYADRAKQIKNKPVVNESETDKLINSLKAEIAALKEQLSGGGFEATGEEGNGSGELVGNLSNAEEEAIKRIIDEKEQALQEEREELARVQAETEELEKQYNIEMAELMAEIDSFQSQMQAYSADELAKLEDLKEQLNSRLVEFEAEKKQMEERWELERNIGNEIAQQERLLVELTNDVGQVMDSLAIAQKELSDLTKTMDEKRKEKAEAEKRREHYLKDCGLTSHELLSLIGVGEDEQPLIPRLVNVSLASEQNHSLVYFLLKNRTMAGAGDGAADILVRGIGVADEHCAFIVEDSDDQNQEPIYRVEVSTGNFVFVNGQKIARSATLHDGDRIMIGRTFMVQFFSTSDAEMDWNMEKDQRLFSFVNGKGVEETVDFETQILAEMAVSTGLVESVEEYFNRNSDHRYLLDCDTLVDEANAIAKTIGRKINYSMDIVTAANPTKNHEYDVNVKVNSFEHKAMVIWSMDELEERLPAMRLALASFLKQKQIRQLRFHRKGTGSGQQRTGKPREERPSSPHTQKSSLSGSPLLQSTYQVNLTTTDSSVQTESQKFADPFFRTTKDVCIGVSFVDLRNLILCGSIQLSTLVRERSEEKLEREARWSDESVMETLPEEVFDALAKVEDNRVKSTRPADSIVPGEGESLDDVDAKKRNLERFRNAIEDCGLRVGTVNLEMWMRMRRDDTDMKPTRRSQQTGSLMQTMIKTAEMSSPGFQTSKQPLDQSLNNTNSPMSTGKPPVARARRLKRIPAPEHLWMSFELSTETSMVDESFFSMLRARLNNPAEQSQKNNGANTLMQSTALVQSNSNSPKRTLNPLTSSKNGSASSATQELVSAILLSDKTIPPTLQHLKMMNIIDSSQLNGKEISINIAVHSLSISQFVAKTTGHYFKIILPNPLPTLCTQRSFSTPRQVVGQTSTFAFPFSTHTVTLPNILFDESVVSLLSSSFARIEVWGLVTTVEPSSDDKSPADTTQQLGQSTVAGSLTSYAPKCTPEQVEAARKKAAQWRKQADSSNRTLAERQEELKRLENELKQLKQQREELEKAGSSCILF